MGECVCVHGRVCGCIQVCVSVCILALKKAMT